MRKIILSKNSKNKDINVNQTDAKSFMKTQENKIADFITLSSHPCN